MPQDRRKNAYQITHLGLITIAILRKELARPGGQAVLYGAAIHATLAKCDLIRQDATPYTRAARDLTTWHVSPFIPTKSAP
jgi:hypothetical protein